LKRRLGQALSHSFSKNEGCSWDGCKSKSNFHEVLPKETKYSIAKQYGITIEELEKRIQRWWLIYLLAINY
jgi:hypothetical protein